MLLFYVSMENGNLILKTAQFDMPPGPMMVVASEEAVYLLEFTDRPGLAQEIEFLTKRTASRIVSGQTQAIRSIEKELHQYFEGNLKIFNTPLAPFGSPFRHHVWEELRKIPYGKTISYSELALAIGKPSSRRAVAQANGANQLAIVVPCHRVIYANGQLGGYAGGVERKQWLLGHEKQK
ncbi:MAG: methylated-DNA--[protein]-cysteine S-methyltransferase [Chlamydiales bacterium]|nr:methylated-DNA--[protein]-cysteine S-methyltransferase [Chlamydiales bacterium]